MSMDELGIGAASQPDPSGRTDNVNEAHKSAFKPMHTTYSLRELIERCFQEAERAGYIRQLHPPSTEQLRMIVDQRKLAEHIALTIVGELQELETMRKIGPMFRMMREIENDFNTLDQAATQDFKLRNLRRTPQEDDL